jgi:hypothetical protein
MDGLLALGLGLLLEGLATGAAPPHLQPLLQGKWPSYARGPANDVQVVGNRAYVALQYGEHGELAILDVSNPASPVQLGGYDTSAWAYSVAVSGSVAYVADAGAGLEIIDVSNPSSPARLGGYKTIGEAGGWRSLT